MLRSVDLLTDAELKQIEDGLAAIGAEIAEQGDAWPGWKVELEDVHMCVEAALVEKTGDAGRKLHTGRSRNDQVALDLRLWAQDAHATVAEKLSRVTGAFVDMAQAQGHVVMPSYTHLQRAQPIVVGGELMAWVAALDRCRGRFTSALQGIDESPLGSGAIAGSCLPLDRQHVVDHLGQFADFSPNAIDATASRDVALDLAYALAMTSMTLSRWAEQWIIYATTEFGFITLDNLYTTGSSMMPQKQNPDMLELIRGKTGQVYGSLIALLTMCKGITVGYNRDLQEDKRHVFAAYDSVCDCLDMAAAIVATTTFNEERIKANLHRGYLDATSLAEYLVTKQVPFRTSHQIVGALVRKAGELDRHELKKLTLGEMQAECSAIEQDVYDWLGPENVVKRYQSAGNAGVSGFEAQLKAWKERING